MVRGRGCRLPRLRRGSSGWTGSRQFGIGASERRLEGRRRGQAPAVAEAKPAAADRFVELNQVQRDVATRYGQLIFERDQRRLRIEDAIEIGDSALELQQDQFDRALGVANAVFEMSGLLLC